MLIVKVTELEEEQKPKEEKQEEVQQHVQDRGGGGYELGGTEWTGSSDHY